MRNLIFAFLTFAFATTSLAASNNCKTLLNNVDKHRTVITEAIDSNDKMESVTNDVGTGVLVSCEDIRSAIKTLTVVVQSTAAIASEMSVAEEQSCKFDSEEYLSAENSYDIYFQFMFGLKVLNDALSAGTCN